MEKLLESLKSYKEIKDKEIEDTIKKGCRNEEKRKLLNKFKFNDGKKFDENILEILFKSKLLTHLHIWHSMNFILFLNS